MARFGFLSSYPPTRCGLATFTDALATSMTTASDQAFVVRVVDESSPPIPRGATTRVVAHLRNGDRRSVLAAARVLNSGDVAIIQHEYGIYGGPDGEEVCTVLDALTVPSIVVLHTVLADPSEHQKSVLEEVVSRATTTVVMSETARGILGRVYDVDASAVIVIPHGVHPFRSVTASPRNAGPTVLTWGLIGPGKGIEHAIEAFAQLADLRPKPMYRVLGQTHPKVLENDGDVYRERLLARVASLGLTESVSIDGRYLCADDLERSILGADIVLLPYDSRIQVTSGVLAEAVAAGKPVVATGFPHAVELLSTGAGMIVPHEDPGAMADALRAILTDRKLAAAMAQTARRISRDTLWPAVGARFRAVAVRLDARVAA